MVNWHSESPYNNIDLPFSTATVTKKDGTKEIFRITAAGGELETTGNYVVLKNGQPYATVLLERKPGAVSRLDSIDRIEAAWFFEKLTGLPLHDFPEDQEYTEFTADGKQTKLKAPLPQKLEKCATIHVTGTEEAKTLLSRGK